MKKKKASRLFLYFFCFVFCVGVLYPYFVMIVNSFKSLNNIFKIPPTILPGGVAHLRTMSTSGRTSRSSPISATP